MKKTITSILLATAVLILLVQPALATSNQASLARIPTFSIVSVVPDTSVTIKTYNFPADDTFTVRMGAYGTLGIGGIVVTTTDSGSPLLFARWRSATRSRASSSSVPNGLTR